jgi:cell division protein FtsI (penicillin-binding protein 3)
MDSPKGQYYGADVAAPVFAEVAQQVLEYLGVPHDIDLRPAKTTGKPAKPVTEDDAAEDQADIQALYEAANDLPSDDPLRNQPAQPAAKAEAAKPAIREETVPPADKPSGPATPQPSSAAVQPPQQAPNPAPQTSKTITLPDPARIHVPSLVGLPIRQVIEQAAGTGLQVQIVGNGTCRQQAPEPGSMVPPGTKIVVRCGR